MLHVYFCIHVKCTKITCFCSEKTVKKHENTSKTVHFMYHIWHITCILVYTWNVPKVNVSAVKTHWKQIKTLAKLCISCIIYGTFVFWYTCEMYHKYMFLPWKHNENTLKHKQNRAFHVLYMVHVYFGIHVKCTKSTCFCRENTLKAHRNTTKPVHFMYNIWHMFILGHMWNVPKGHVSAVKKQLTHLKTLAKLCISCIIYGKCLFWNTCEMYQKYKFLQWKQSENTWKH
jgi:hypothetical protein